MLMDRFENLANAIILQAVKDYRKLERRATIHPQDTKTQYAKNCIEEFFLSEWFSALTKVNGAELLKRLGKEAA